MQIHELNRPSKPQVNEVDLVGPNSILNVGKQVLKNPAAVTSSSALGAAQQAASQASAAASAKKLAAQGYNVSANRPVQVSMPQVLQAVQQNPAIQQQVNNLTAQWLTQAPTVINAVRMANTARMASAANARRNVPEAVVIGNPEATRDPAERRLLDVYYQQQAAKGEVTGTAPETPATPDADDRSAVNSQLQDIVSEFTRWSDSKLATGGITMENIRSNPQYKKMLEDQLLAIAIQSLADPKSPAATQAINAYFNTAIAAIQTEVKLRQSGASQAAIGNTAGQAQPATDDTEVLNLLQQQGISLTKAQLQKLGQLVASANNNNFNIRNTGNPIMNAIARIAGLRVTT
jgi:hypothetical protein